MKTNNYRLDQLFENKESHKGKGIRSELEIEVFSEACDLLNKGERVLTLGVLDTSTSGYGFLRYFSTNLKITKSDVYVSKKQIQNFELKNGDLLECSILFNEKSKYFQIGELLSVNGKEKDKRSWFRNFYDKTSYFPDQQIKLADGYLSETNRILDLITPLGYGQRGIVASPPKCGKTQLIENIAKGGHSFFDEVIVLMIAERPEETTYISKQLPFENIKVISSNFDEEPNRHVNLTKLIAAYCIRQVEEGNKKIMLLIDSLTRFVRAANYLNQGGKLLTGGLDINSLLSIKPILGSARNFGEDGSLTVLGTMLIDTGSKMDDIIFDECKGTSNMDIILDKSLASKGVFPSIDLNSSSTRRFNLMMSEENNRAIFMLRKILALVTKEEALERLKKQIKDTKDNKIILENLLKINSN